jgi:COP9 signalosome complex subunit 7
LSRTHAAAYSQPLITISRSSTTASVLSTLDEKIASISAQAALAKENKEKHDKAVQDILKDIVDKQSKDKGSRKGTMYSENSPMDIDEPVPESKGKGLFGRNKYVNPVYQSRKLPYVYFARSNQDSNAGKAPSRKRNRF